MEEKRDGFLTNIDTGKKSKAYILKLKPDDGSRCIWTGKMTKTDED